MLKLSFLFFTETLTPEPSDKLQETLHFQDEWLYKFDKKNTRQEIFYVNNNEKINVSMMSQTNKFKYLDQLGYQLVQIFFKEGIILFFSLYIFHSQLLYFICEYFLKFSEFKLLFGFGSL